MAKRIQQLSTLLSNQIAAGEVIERPASVVKELLENSLDAKAQAITITIDKGGSRLIQIRDDGVGIHPDDLSLAIGRHATSKIAALSDLDEIQTLGFRGEALASIAAVSRFNLSSKQVDCEHAWQIQVAGEESNLQAQPTSHPNGTTVSVRDLFFNTPARRRFMRSEHTEFSHIEECVKRQALSQFKVAFKLVHNGRIILNLPAATTLALQEKRLAKIFGNAFLQNCLYINIEHAPFKLSGWLGLPTFNRNQMDMQYFYVNQRIIKDKLINHALRQVYQDYLPQGRHNAYLLFFDLDPSAIDVNVHPTKHEVRFHQARLVHDFLSHAVANVLTEQAKTTTQLEIETSVNSRPSQTYELTNKTSGAKLHEQRAFYELAARHSIPAAVAPRETAKPKLIFARCIAILHQKYLLAETATSLLTIDIKCAQAALLQVQLQQAWQEQVLSPQPLLIPETIKAEGKQQGLLEKHQTNLQQLGVVLAELSPQLWVLRELPALVRQLDASEFLQQLLVILSSFDKFDGQSILHCLAKIAGSKLAGDFDNKAADKLIADLVSMDLLSATKKRNKFCYAHSLEEIAAWF